VTKCKICGDSYKGEDCPTCKTVSSIDLSEFTGGKPIYVRTAAVEEQQSKATLEESSTHHKFPVAYPKCRIGRDASNDIVINGDESVSRFHFVIEYENGESYVADVGSKNGTFLNGKPILERMLLQEGDRLRSGRLRFKFLVEAGTAGPEDYPIYLSEPGSTHGDDSARDAASGVETGLRSTLDMTLPQAATELTSEEAQIKEFRSAKTMPIPDLSKLFSKPLFGHSEPPAPAKASGDLPQLSEPSPQLYGESSPANAEPPQPYEELSAANADLVQPYEESTEASTGSSELNMAPPEPFLEQQEKPVEAAGICDEAPAASEEPAAVPDISAIAQAELFNDDVPNGVSDLDALFSANYKKAGESVLSPLEETPGQPGRSTYPSAEGARDLMSKLEEMTQQEPEWCSYYLPSELERLEEELSELNERVRLAQHKMREVESRISLTKGLRKSLLSSRGDDLVTACTKVFELLGWAVKRSGADEQEVWLSADDQTVALGRVVWTNCESAHQDLGKIAMSQVSHWCQYRTEPKGVLVVNTLADATSAEPKEAQFSEEIEEYARKKNVCLMTTLQLLCIYKDIELGDASAENLRQQILATTGLLPGFKLEPSESLVPA